MPHGLTNVAQDEGNGEAESTKGLTLTHRTSRGDTPSGPTSHYLLTPTHTNTHTTHRENFSWCLYSLPPCIYTLKGMESLVVTSYSSLSLSRPLSFLVLSLPRPRPPAGPSIHDSLKYVIHTHTSLGVTPNMRPYPKGTRRSHQG